MAEQEERDLVADNQRLRKALEGIVGETDPEELRKMKLGVVLVMSQDNPEREALLFALDTLLEIPEAIQC